MIWDENNNIAYFFEWEKKTLFWTNKKFVYLIFINKLSWYHPKICILRSDIKVKIYSEISYWILDEKKDKKGLREKKLPKIFFLKTMLDGILTRFLVWKNCVR